MCTGSKVNTSNERIASCAGKSLERGPQSLKATPPPAIMLSVLPRGRNPTRQIRIGSSRVVLDIRHNREPILGRNDDYSLTAFPDHLVD